MPNIERLQKLADHLLSGKLGHKVFAFDTYNSGGTKENPCGTAGCAIGECPIVWPDEWEFKSDYRGYFTPLLKTSIVFDYPRPDGCEFFELNTDQYTALFIPDRQHLYDLPELDRYATAKEVAENILLFIQKIKGNAEY